jgi:hypothetical protein
MDKSSVEVQEEGMSVPRSLRGELELAANMAGDITSHDSVSRAFYVS